MTKVKSRFTTAQFLRFPLIFGGILGAFITAFMYRKTYFREEIEAVRQKNYEEGVRRQEIMDQAKEMAVEEILAKHKAKQK